MECNEVQWSATRRNNKAKRIVLSTKKALDVGGESHSQLFLQKTSPIHKPFYKRPLYFNVRRLIKNVIVKYHIRAILKYHR